jgi:hypothetical protein
LKREYRRGHQTSEARAAAYGLESSTIVNGMADRRSAWECGPISGEEVEQQR